MPSPAAPTARPAVAFEVPATRDDELRGRPGLVRFLLLAPRRVIAIDGRGPAGPDAFKPIMPGLYGTAWSLRFALKARGLITRVGPLEGLWWTADGKTDLDAIFAGSRADWRWTLCIGLPDEAAADEVAAALSAGRARLDPTIASGLRVDTLAEGHVAQLLHVGPYAAERQSLDHLHAAVAEAGLQLYGPHHEVYLGDPTRSAPERLRTLLRHAVR